MPDATGLELIAQELREELGGAGGDDPVLDTLFFRGHATLTVRPAGDPRRARAPARQAATRSWRACTASTTTPTSRASA